MKQQLNIWTQTINAKIVMMDANNVHLVLNVLNVMLTQWLIITMEHVLVLKPNTFKIINVTIVKLAVKNVYLKPYVWHVMITIWQTQTDNVNAHKTNFIIPFQIHAKIVTLVALNVHL